MNKNEETKKQKLSTESYKGVRDFYPEEQSFLNYLRDTCKKIVERFGYVEYHASVLEPAELYKSKGVENEEIINDQSYTFIDRGGREVTLRPEMTPTVARMVAGKRRELGFPLRLYSLPNLFRYERPQRGRLREHWQLNVDLFGSQSCAADAEVVALAHNILKEFGAKDTDFEIRIGSRTFLNNLMQEFAVVEEAQNKFLYLLDRRKKMPAEEFEGALKEFGIPLQRLSAQTVPIDVAQVLELLREQFGVTNAQFDPSIVRGFAYYTGVVFEVFDTHPDNNRSMFGGGRYDNLTAMFDDDPIVGVGFGMGDVTIHNFLESRNLLPTYAPPTQLYIAITEKSVLPFALSLAEELRQCGVCVATDFGDKKLTDQIKTASKHKIPYLTVVGENELTANIFAVRNLETGTETKCERTELARFFEQD
ncbi:MAG: histidine--tRNA ligase [bacterium]